MLILRWTARMVTLFLLGLAVLIMIGEQFAPLKLGATELAMSIAFLTALIGMLVLWKWEGLGGGLVLVGMLVFYGINFAASGRFPSGWFFPLYYLPGVLSLTCWLHDQWRKLRMKPVRCNTKPD